MRASVSNVVFLRIRLVRRIEIEFHFNRKKILISSCWPGQSIYFLTRIGFHIIFQTHNPRASANVQVAGSKVYRELQRQTEFSIYSPKIVTCHRQHLAQRTKANMKKRTQDSINNNNSISSNKLFAFEKISSSGA